MSNLFISHSSRDNAAAKELQASLEEQGHRSVFFDLDPETGIQASVSWERTLFYTKVRACRAVVALCSDSYLASQWGFAPAPPITSEMRRDQESLGLESGRLSAEPR